MTLVLLIPGYTLFAAILFSAVAILAEAHYRQLPELTDCKPTNGDPGGLPIAHVAVIVPARNEAHIIGRVVTSLAALNYPNVQITVVDDHSTDQTAICARSAGAQVLQLEVEPPPGWTGKCNACEQGARSAVNVDWLLFTDADTYHAPDSLYRAVTYAETHHLDAVSLLLRQECVGFWDKLLLPLAYQNFFAMLRPRKTVFNGQYILIRRNVYIESGGFGAVRGRVMEDVALAELLTRQGYKVALVNGHRAASVRMYADFGALLRGMTKTAFTAARDRGAGGWLLGSVTFVGVFTILMGLYGLASGQIAAILGAALITLINALGLVPWMARFGVRPALGYALCNLIGIGLLWLIGMVSTFRAVFGVGVRWKGRTIVERHS